MKWKNVFRKVSALALALALLVVMVPPCMAAEAEDNVSEARNGVVRVFAWDKKTGMCGSGTGFGVGKAGEETQYFVTNWHVVTSSGEFDIGEMEIYIILSNEAVELVEKVAKIEQGDVYVNRGISNIDESEMIKCQVVYSADQYPDVAILKAERKVPGRVALPLKSSRDVKVASRVWSLGYPAVADTASSTYEKEENLKVGDVIRTFYYYGDVDSVHINGGVVSKLDDFEIFGGTYCLEHDAHINNGNSGGPLVDANGYVVGINTYGINSDDFLNYSVYIDYAMDYLNQLGIAYDYVGGEEEFPVVPVAIGGGVAVVLAVVLVVLLKKKPRKETPEDTGLRVQYDSDAMLAGKRYVINGTLRFGRAADCNILYEDDASGISGHHCEILVENGKVFIRDLNSTYGTFVNGGRIPANQNIPLPVGTKVSLGSVKECFQIVRSTKK